MKSLTNNPIRNHSKNHRHWLDNHHTSQKSSNLKLLWFLRRVLQCHFRLIVRVSKNLWWLIRAKLWAHAQCRMKSNGPFVMSCARALPPRDSTLTSDIFIENIPWWVGGEIKKDLVACLLPLSPSNQQNKAPMLLFASSNQMIDKYKENYSFLPSLNLIK